MGVVSLFMLCCGAAVTKFEAAEAAKADGNARQKERKLLSKRHESSASTRLLWRWWPLVCSVLAIIPFSWSNREAVSIRGKKEEEEREESGRGLAKKETEKKWRLQRTKEFRLFSQDPSSSLPFQGEGGGKEGGPSSHFRWKKRKRKGDERQHLTSITRREIKKNTFDGRRGILVLFAKTSERSREEKEKVQFRSKRGKEERVKFVQTLSNPCTQKGRAEMGWLEIYTERGGDGSGLAAEGDR